MTDEQPVQPDPRVLLLIALLQGLALLLLHQALQLQHRPYPHWPWLLALYSVALVTPAMLLLGLRAQGNAPV